MLKKRMLIFAIILIPTFLAISAGFLVLSFMDRIPPGVRVGAIDAAGLDKTLLNKKFNRLYSNELENGRLELLVKDKAYSIRFKDIDLYFDVEQTYKNITGNSFFDFLKNMEKGYFFRSRRQVEPVFKFDESKLVRKLQVIVDKKGPKPKNADILIKDGKLVKIKEVNGMKLVPEKVVAYISGVLSKSFGNTVKIAASHESGFIDVKPEYTVEDYKDIHEIIAAYSTIINEKDRASVEIAAAAVNKVVVRPARFSKGKNQDVFSFNKRLQASGKLTKRENNGYSQVASTLYAALLLAGVDSNAIKKVQAKTWTDYIEPGLDAIVGEESSDLLFRNTLDSPIIILAEVKGNMLTIRLAGKKDPQIKSIELKIDIDQKYEPSVIYIENENLEPGEEKLVSPGREGLEVSIYKIITFKNAVTEQFLLDKRVYKAVDAIVQVAPDMESPAKLK